MVSIINNILDVKTENLSSDDKIKYFNKLKKYCMETYSNNNENVNLMLYKLFPLMRNFNYEIIGEEFLPDDGCGLFVCNHSNSHDFFTAQEVFKKLGSNVSVFAASDDLNIFSKFIFKSCNSVLIDRYSKDSIQKGIIKFSSKLINGIPGVIFGEGTWNLHPYKPMQPIKIGSAKMAAISDVKIIPTIFEYVEVPMLCNKEKNLYSKCIIKFGEPIKIRKDDNLILKTNLIQFKLENMRLDLWNDLSISKMKLDDVDKELYLNHTYLKKYDAFGFQYDSEKESKFLLSKNNSFVENEFCLNSNNEFIPGIIKKKCKLK